MSKITDCIDAISLWMSSNRLKLNGDKTQFIWLGSRQRLSKISKDNLVIQGAKISPLDSVRDLGVIIDCKLTMEDHVNSVVKSCFFQLRQLGSIRRSLPTDARKALVHSFVASRIDYCNAILYGVSDADGSQCCCQARSGCWPTSTHDTHPSESALAACKATDPLQDRHHFVPLRPGRGPGYLTEMFSRVSDTSGRANLRSAACGDSVIKYNDLRSAEFLYLWSDFLEHVTSRYERYEHFPCYI